MFLVLALLAVLLGPAASDFLRIDPYRKECILEWVPQYAKIRLSFEVIEGGFLDIDVEITGPDNKVLLQEERGSSGIFTLVAHMDGGYKFCFANELSTQIKKTVMVTIDISKAPEGKATETEAATVPPPTAAGVLSSAGVGVAAESVMSVSTTTSGKGVDESLVDILQLIGAEAMKVATSVAGTVGEALLDALSSLF